MTRSGRGLSGPALALRAGHVVIAAALLFSLGYLWWCALTDRRGPLLRGAIAALVGEGLALVVGRGKCPLGPLQRRVGDPTPLFELALPPRAARRAVPALFGVSVLGLIVLLARGRRLP